MHLIICVIVFFLSSTTKICAPYSFMEIVFWLMFVNNFPTKCSGFSCWIIKINIILRQLGKVNKNQIFFPDIVIDMVYIMTFAFVKGFSHFLFYHFSINDNHLKVLFADLFFCQLSKSFSRYVKLHDTPKASNISVVHFLFHCS